MISLSLSLSFHVFFFFFRRARIHYMIYCGILDPQSNDRLREVCIKAHPVQYRKKSLMFRHTCLPEEIAARIHGMRAVEDLWIDDETVQQVLGYSRNNTASSTVRPPKDHLLDAFLLSSYHKQLEQVDIQLWNEYRVAHTDDRHLAFAYLYRLIMYGPSMVLSSPAPIITDRCLAHDLVSFSWTAVGLLSSIFLDELDEELYMIAFRQNPITYTWLPPHLKDNKSIIMETLQRRRQAQHAELRLIYRNLSTQHQEDVDIIKAALQTRAEDYCSIPVITVSPLK